MVTSGSTPLRRLGLIGLDTSHVTAFTQLLHAEGDPHHVPGFRVVAAVAAGSPQFALSRDRIAGFTDELRSRHGVTIVPEIGGLPKDLDAILLESVDGRQHLAQFAEIAPRGIPIFIDKPLAASAADAQAIAQQSLLHSSPVMSCSALRYADAFMEALGTGDGAVTGIDLYGPMPFIPELPRYFWYGVHTVEMLFRAFGPGARRVQAISNERFDVITAEWADGRMATIRGHRAGNTEFGGVIHRPATSVPFRIGTGKVPFYASLLRAIAGFVTTGHSPVALAESVEIVRFLEAANLSQERAGQWVALA